MLSSPALRLLLTVLVCVSCRAEDDIRQGAEGELCNGRDEDCRTGLYCEGSICQPLGPQPTYSCDEICARLADCDATNSGCASDCRLTIDDWSFRAKDDFGICLVETLSCEEAAAEFAPQTCYERIVVPAARRDRCDSFADAGRDCGADLETREAILEGCVAVARVSPESRWTSTERCARAVETGICSGIARCLNDELELEPAVSLGN